jgi:hypothetical protein
MDDLEVGKRYRLRFPGIATRVMEALTGLERSCDCRYLVESGLEKSLVGQQPRRARQH